MKNKILTLLILSIILLSSCAKDKNLEFDVKFKLLYGGEPLVMLEDYTYPTGEAMNFTRYSFYLTNVKGISENDETELSAVEYLNFTALNETLTGAEEGITLAYKNLGDRDFEKISFTIGVDPINNAKTPADFNSTSPLSKTAEYWTPWQSYIFTKTEGKIDFGNAEKDNFALHTGGDEAAVTFTFDTEGIGGEAKKTLEISIDIKDTFGNDNIYDIKSNPSLHALSQKPQVLELVNNFKTSVTASMK